MDRLPFRATAAAARYEAVKPLPVTVVAEDIRSLYNVGALFRAADGAGVERIVLCGITGCPPNRGITKTALGAEEHVAWEYSPGAVEALERLSRQGYQLAAIETALHAVDLFDWEPCFPVSVVFGNELAGLSAAVLERVDVVVQLPMLGFKDCLNVATAAGVVLYELLRKYRRAVEQAAILSPSRAASR